MPSKTLVNSEDIIEIKKVLKKFQEGYENRNLKALDSYMKELFINDNSVITVGTSRGEWCFGVDELRVLISSDWEYWGNVKLDYVNSKINSKDTFAWFIADCTLTWSDVPEDFDEWCYDLVSAYYDEEGLYVNYSKMAKLTMMNIKLAFLLYSSHNKKGAGVSNPLRLSGTLIKENNKWLICKLHFSIPMPSYPEWRIDINNPDSLKYHNEEKAKMCRFAENIHTDSRKDITEILNNLQACYLNKAINVKDAIKDMFLSYDDIYIVDPNENPVAIGSKSMAMLLQEQREKWNEMQLSINEAIIRTEKDVALIVTNGIFKKHSNSDELLSKEMLRIKEILQEDGKGENKLFEAQKQIAYTLKELAYGEESSWEFRFEATAVKEKDIWKFHNIQFSYPSLYVFEGNYHMIPLL